MRFLARILLIAVCCAIVHAQARFPMKYLDDVGSLGSELDRRKSANLGIASVSSEDGLLRFEGRDRKGDPWLAWVTQTGGVGWTEVWTADFDHNGQRDLLIASHFPGNGRCVRGADLLFLLFDQSGRPVPWHVPTELPNGNKFPYLPALLLDENRNGQAEIVSTECAYSSEGILAVDWSITGIYEARDAQWIPLRDAVTAPYLQAARKANGVKDWLPIKSGEWPDQLAGFKASANTKLEHLLPGDESCRGIRVNVVDGRVVVLDHDPCDELRYDHALYSDGLTRRGWPWVVR